MSAGKAPAHLPERPMPPVKRLCSKCDVRLWQVDRGQVVVSPRGTAHNGMDGDTWCGVDATGPNWWWPL